MFPASHVHGHTSCSSVMTFQKLATVILALAVMAACLACYWITARTSLPERVKNIWLSATTLLVIFLGTECFFLHFEQSSAIDERWSYKLWDKKYMTTRSGLDYINSKGQKQNAFLREPLRELKKGQKSIWFIGDSFTYGFGLENTYETFPAQVEKQLGENTVCLNLGNGGADTYQEKDILFAVDRIAAQPPAAVVWQYFGNDIDSADEGPDIYDKGVSNDSWVRIGRTLFEGKSFLLDYLYWQFFRAHNAESFNVYMDFLKKAYLSDSIVVNGKAEKDSAGYITLYRKHLAPLQEAASYYKNRGIKFLVIIFPYLWRDGPENSEKIYSHRLENDLKAENTDVINLAPLLKDIPADKRMVNSHDAHPTARVDRLVADTIVRYFAVRYNM